MNELTISSIATVRCPLRQKFGTPRQSGLCPSLTSQLVFERTPFNEQALADLTQCSHLWVISGFHLLPEKPNKSPKVRPPRLGGNKKMGVFATRSPFRPNPLGLSHCRFQELKIEGKKIIIVVTGLDLVDGTPIFDIKPYIRHADSLPEADSPWDHIEDNKLRVHFMPEVRQLLLQEKINLNALEEVLACDPRPSFQNDPKRRYGMNFNGIELFFYVENELLVVSSLGMSL